MSLDPVLASIAEATAGAPGPLDGEIEEARERLRRAITAHPDITSRDWVGAIHDLAITSGGTTVDLRMYPAATGNRARVAVFVHGGGYALSAAELSDDICCRLAHLLDAYVVAVDYRLAPEHPWPAAFDDVVAAAQWAVDNVGEIVGAQVPVFLIGESAGSNIAAAASQTVHGLAGQVLVVPGPDFESLASVSEVPGSMLSPRDIERIVQVAFGGDHELVRRFPASPIRGDQLAQSPASVIALAGYDPTAVVGRAYAAALAGAGVPVEVVELPDMFHPFLGFAHLSPGAARAVDRICSAALALLDR